MQIFTNYHLQNKSYSELCDWINEYRERLVGSAIFTQNNGLCSKLVRFAEEGKCPDGGFPYGRSPDSEERNEGRQSRTNDSSEPKEIQDGGFIPTHTGSIIEYNGQVCIFDMKPPRAEVTRLFYYLRNTTDKYAIVLRDFLLDVNMFSANIAEHIGEFYPYMSAIRSAFSKHPSKWRRHCSELHLRELQKQSVYTNLNPEITPDELWHAMTGRYDGRKVRR